jgi:hypothetical protein
VCGQRHAPDAFTPGKEPVPIVHEAGWAPEPVCIGAENLAPPGFDPRTFQSVASHYLILRVLDYIVLFHLLCILYCGCFNLFCNVWVRVHVWVFR